MQSIEEFFRFPKSAIFSSQTVIQLVTDEVAALTNLVSEWLTNGNLDWF